MRDLKLTTARDLDFDGYDFALVDQGDEVAQRVATRVYTIQGEWAFDDSLGLKRFGRGSVHDTRLPHAERAALIRALISATPGVRRIDTFEVVIDNENHGMRIVCHGEHVYSEESFEIVI